MARLRTVAAGVLALGAACGHAAETHELVTRYRCTLPDGTTISLTRDLSPDFRMSVGNCKPVAVRSVSETHTAEPMVPANEIDNATTVSIAVRTIRAIPDTARTLSATVVASMPADVSAWLDAACRRHGVDRGVAAAVMFIESRFRASARSPRGALGLMQLLPTTASRYGTRSANDLLDPKTNIDVGVRHLRDLIDRFPGRLDLALAAYNAGEGAVVQYGYQVPPFAETQRYVQQVLAHLNGEAPPL